MKHLTETDRYRQGPPYNKDALSTHSVRVYQNKLGVEYCLARNLSIFGPISNQLSCYTFHNNLAKPIPLDLSEVTNWKQAEAKLDDFIGKLMKPEVRLP